jgi:hypothetical protein
MDHHRSGPYANLFTDLDLGYGLRPFASGGAKNRGAYSGGRSLGLRPHGRRHGGPAWGVGRGGSRLGKEPEVGGAREGGQRHWV